MKALVVLPALAAVLATSALAAEPPADDRAREEALFGGDEPAAEPAKPPEAANEQTGPADARGANDFGDERMKGGEAKVNADLLYKDKSQIGGFLYMRGTAAWSEGARLSDTQVSNPNLFDLYFDSRLNDRLRAFARGRVLYNPIASSQATAGVNAQTALGAATSADTTKALLTQLWLKFDVAHVLFVTVGQQFLRWGTTRFWNPVDVLNTTKVNPLAFFDERVGVPMLKLHLPIEKLGWNFYGIVLADGAATVDRLGAALRAEALFGHTEIGVASLFRKSVDPKLGVDISSGVGDFDVTGELGVVFPRTGDPQWQAAAGLSWTWAYREDDSLVLGVEYFHNQQGLTQDGVYNATKQAVIDQLAAGVAVPQLPSFTPLYTSRDYIGAVATVISPGSLNDSNISAISLTNLTDHSGTAQLNFSLVVLTDLTVETYAGMSYGDGELRGNIPYLQQRLPTEAAYPLVRDNPIVAAFMSAHAPLLRGGVNLRVSL